MFLKVQKNLDAVTGNSLWDQNGLYGSRNENHGDCQVQTVGTKADHTKQAASKISRRQPSCELSLFTSYPHKAPRQWLLDTCH